MKLKPYNSTQRKRAPSVWVPNVLASLKEPRLPRNQPESRWRATHQLTRSANSRKQKKYQAVSFASRHTNVIFVTAWSCQGIGKRKKDFSQQGGQQNTEVKSWLPVRLWMLFGSTSDVPSVHEEALVRGLVIHYSVCVVCAYKHLATCFSSYTKWQMISLKMAAMPALFANLDRSVP